MNNTLTTGGQIGLRFGVWWTFLTIAGFAVGFPAGFIAGELGLGNPGIEIVSAGVVGFMQWLALRQVLRGTGFWALANAAGFLVAAGVHAAACYIWKLPDDMGISIGAIVWASAFVLGGVLAGLLQQRILKSHVQNSGWWVPASAAGWGLAITGTAAWFFLLPPIKSHSFVLVLLRNLVIPTALGASILGIITACTIIWLLRRPKTQI